jgi:DNA-binding SARP family transcriptional activator
VEGCAVVVLPVRKAEALLAYLALPPGRLHSREKLTAFLWGDAAEAQARQSFRQTLSRLRRALPDGGRGLVVDRRDDVGLDPAAVSVDAVEFEAAVTAGDLERAVDLYRGDLLDGFTLAEAPFEEWRSVERERLRELAVDALARLLRGQIQAERVPAALRTGQRILAMDPLQESVHRAVMRLLLRDGRRAMALQQYQTCVATLQRELGIEPEEETRRLYREILRTSRAVEPPAGGAAAAPGAAARAVDTPMIGRQAERERVLAAVTRMLDHGGHVVLVTGEAGIGKSRLIQECLASEAVRPLRLAFGRCHETERTLPFRPWIDALRAAGPVAEAPVRERLGAASCAQLGALFPELLPRDAAGAAGLAPTVLFEPLLDLVGALAAEQPLVIVIEDLHWADTMSARLLAFLGRRIHRWPVLVVGSTRPEELIDAPALAQALKELRDDGCLEEVALGPLSETESRALARALSPSGGGGPELERLAGEIWQASHGSPFVIVESVRGLQQGAGEAWARSTRIGRRVQDFVAARLDRLAERPRHCVAVAAVIGRAFPFALLVRAAGLSEREAADAIEELVRRRILDAVGDRLDFCHDWIRTVAYERLLPARRAALHATIGEAMEDLHRDALDDVADQLGSHYSRAGNFRKAVAYLVRFGRLAALRYALDDASRAFAQGLSLVDRLREPDRDRARLEVILHQAFVLSTLGRQQAILELLQAHAGVLPRVDDPALACEYYFRLGLTRLFLCRHAEAHAAAERALAQGERVGDPAAMGKALHVLSLHAYATGRPAEGAAHATRAATLLDRRDTQDWLGLAQYDAGLNHLVAGDLAAALDAAARAEAVGHAARIPRLLAFSGFLVGWVNVLRGEAQRAEAIVRQALTISRDPIVTPSLRGVLGHALLEGGQPAAAVAVLEEVVEDLAHGHRLVRDRNLVRLGEAHLAAGDAARAEAAIAEALRSCRADDVPYNIGLALRALAHVRGRQGDPGAAERLLGEALDAFARCQAAFEAAGVRLDLAAALAARGEVERARAHLADALPVLEAAGASRRATEARRLAASLGPPATA